MNSTSTEVATRPNGSMSTVREEFGATQMQVQVETAATAIAARERSVVEAQYIMAMRRPRNLEEVRVRMLSECGRTGFAEVARYRKPVGKRKNEQTGEWEQSYAEGFSIRFAEMALRHMGNMKCDALPIFDNEEIRIVMMQVVDLESNSTIAKPITLAKTVERRELKKYQSAISERMNSNNQKIYIVAATDDEINMKEASAWSKFMRNLLRFVPGDILDECEQKIQKTLTSQTEQNPEAAKRKVIDAFNSVGVGPTDLEMFLGHSLSRLQPAEIDELRGIYSAIKDGETTWTAVMDTKETTGSQELQDEVLKRKLAEAEKFKQQQQNTTPTATGTGSGETAGAQPAGADRETPTSANDGSGSSGETTGAQPAGTSSEIPAASTPGKEQKPKLQFGGKK